MFEFNPSKGVAEKAQHFQNERVKKSLIFLFKEYIKKIGIDDSKTSLIISNLLKIKKLTPEIHYLHYAFQDSMRKQKASCAGIYFHKLLDIIFNYSFKNNCISISSVSNLEWECFVIEETKRLTLEDCGEMAEIDSISGVELSRAKDQVCAALCSIAKHDTGMFDEIEQHVQMIKLFRGKITMGFTDARILGAMLIRIPREIVSPVPYFVEHIVHEASHIHLNCLMVVDSLILNSPDDRFVSPLRADPRPMVGILHATFVSARISRTFIKMYLSTGNVELLQIIAEALDETIRGISEIERSAKLTICGDQLVSSMKQLLDSAKHVIDWKSYNFEEKKMHRFGAGETRVADVKRAVA